VNEAAKLYDACLPTHSDASAAICKITTAWSHRKKGAWKRTLNVADRNCYKTMFELKHRRLTLVSFNANMSFTNVIEPSP